MQDCEVQDVGVEEMQMVGGVSLTPVLLAATDVNYDRSTTTETTVTTTIKTTVTDTCRAAVTRSERSTVRIDGTPNEDAGQKPLPDVLVKPPDARLARWKQARATTQRISQVDTITKRWHKDVDSVWKRLLLACTMNHTLCAGILHRGSPGYSRAQTVMILVNSFAFELIMLCLFYEVPEPVRFGNMTDGAAAEEAEPAMVINPVAIVISSVFAALICIPTMLTFAWLYEPMIFVRLSQWVVRVTFCSPFRLCAKFSCNLARVQAAREHSSSEGEADGAADTLESAEKSPVDVILPVSPTPEDDAMATKAATAIQASWRMHDTPRKLVRAEEEQRAATRLQSLFRKLKTRRTWSQMLGQHKLDTSARSMQRAWHNRVGRARPSVPHRAPSEVSPPASPPPASAPPVASSGSAWAVSPSAASPSAASPSSKALSSRRSFSYESLNEVMLKASLTRSWKRKDWPAVRKILFGWGCNHLLFFTMLFFFLFYGCEIFEPNLESAVDTRRRLARGGGVGGGTGGTASRDGTGPALRVAGNTDELLIAWALSAFQRFVLHEPTLILAQKGLPMLFASAFCANCCGETIVNSLSLFFEAVMAVAKEIRG